MYTGCRISEISKLPQAMQRVLGHSTAWMTARYVHMGSRNARLATISFAAQIKR